MEGGKDGCVEELMTAINDATSTEDNKNAVKIEGKKEQVVFLVALDADGIKP